MNNLAPYTKKFKETRREARGLQVFGMSKNFDDSKILPETRDYSITQITVLYYEDMVMGLETLYTLADNAGDMTIESFAPDQKRDLMKSVAISLVGSEYLSTIEIFTNSHCVEFLRMTTTRGNRLEAGSKKNLTRCKHSTYDIKRNEMPVSFFGSIHLPFIGKGNQTNVSPLSRN